jgi:exopolysaccharide biosynthesis protein
MYEDGSLEVIKESKTKLDSINNPRNVWTFGPGLIKDGKISVTENQEIAGPHRINNPRTAIGIIDKNHYIFMVSDGRTSESEGLSLYEMAEYLQSLGCTTAYNLDGGGSSTMVFNGKLINKPTHTGYQITERKVSDIVYIGY